MIAKLTAPLRESPVAVPALAAVVLFVVWSAGQAGYPLTHWAPGGLIVLALLLLAIGAIGVRVGDIPPTVRVAVAALAAYTAWSFLSVIWAAAPAEAWEGANRTLVYLLVFALFACWRSNGASAVLVLGTWVLAMAGLAVFALLHVNAASGAHLQSLLPEGRLVYPAGYANANAAQWLMAAWPALMLAASARLRWWARGLFAGAAVVLAGVALLSQSRGSLYATPVMLLLVFVLLPGRVRTFAAIVPVALGVGAAAPAILHVGGRLHERLVIPSHVHTAMIAILAAGAAVAAVAAVVALCEGRLELSEGTASRAHTFGGAVALATLVAVLAGGWVAVGNPVRRVEHAWNTFTSPLGYEANSSGNRLTSGFGSERYDFYRVAADQFVAHPLLGIGADNFAQQYLVHGRSEETPRYPHSVEFRTLVETGVVGVLLALAGLAAALAAGMRACRSASLRAADPLAATVAGAALAGFAYWLVHGSFDWFFEFAGLGAPAFAMLGLACSLTPRARGERPAAAPPRRVRRAGVLAAALLALAAAASLTLPWLSGLEIDEAAKIWPRTPLAAYSRLEDASSLNPLSDQAQVLAGSIALRFGDLSRARREFALALGRVPHDAYAALELGAIASSEGDTREGLRLIERAVSLEPREKIARTTLAIARSGRRVNVNELNSAILQKAEELR